MTTEPKLLTEAEWREVLIPADGAADPIIKRLRERGLIAEEPVDPLLVEAQEICAEWCEGRDATDCARRYRTGEWDDTPHVAIALAALRRGMELAPRKTLTREMVLKAHWHATGAETVEANLIDRLHAALTEALQ